MFYCVLPGLGLTRVWDQVQESQVVSPMDFLDIRTFLPDLVSDWNRKGLSLAWDQVQGCRMVSPIDFLNAWTLLTLHVKISPVRVQISTVCPRPVVAVYLVQQHSHLSERPGPVVSAGIVYTNSEVQYRSRCKRKSRLTTPPSHQPSREQEILPESSPMLK